MTQWPIAVFLFETATNAYMKNRFSNRGDEFFDLLDLNAMRHTFTQAFQKSYETRYSMPLKGKYTSSLY